LLLINGGLTAVGLYVASLRYPQPLNHAQE
jgi:hypothetical protein